MSKQILQREKRTIHFPKVTNFVTNYSSTNTFANKRGPSKLSNRHFLPKRLSFCQNYFLFTPFHLFSTDNYIILDQKCNYTNEKNPKKKITGNSNICWMEMTFKLTAPKNQIWQYVENFSYISSQWAHSIPKQQLMYIDRMGKPCSEWHKRNNA